MPFPSDSTSPRFFCLRARTRSHLWTRGIVDCQGYKGSLWLSKDNFTLLIPRGDVRESVY